LGGSVTGILAQLSYEEEGSLAKVSEEIPAGERVRSFSGRKYYDGLELERVDKRKFPPSISEAEHVLHGGKRQGGEEQRTRIRLFLRKWGKGNF